MSDYHGTAPEGQRIEYHRDFTPEGDRPPFCSYPYCELVMGHDGGHAYFGGVIEGWLPVLASAGKEER